MTAESHPSSTTVQASPRDASEGDRYLEVDSRADVEVVVPATVHASTGSTGSPVGDKGYRWAKLVSDLLTPDYLETLTGTLRDYSSLPDTVTLQLFQYLVSVYQHRLAQDIETYGIDAIDTSLPHLKLAAGRRKGPQRLELVLDEDKTKAYLKNSLAEFFNHAGFKEEFARAIGANLVIWALEDIEASISPDTLQQISLSSLKERCSAYLLDPSSPVLQEKISFFGQIYCQDITQKIIDGFNLPNCTLQDIEKILGLKQRPPAETETNLTLDPIAVVPTCIPIASSIRAQLRPDLWQRSDDELAVFHYRSRVNPANYIEHYITNPGDIAMLPWEAAEQIINKFGFDTVKLQLIFAAQTMDQGEPWKSTFTLRASDIIQLLGWDKNHNTNMPEKRNAVASTAYALSCLLVRSVWVEGRGRRQIDASTPIGRMWDVLIDPHGQIDWVTGKIEKPEEVYITISPGLWTKHFLNRAGSKAKEALHQFGYLAKDILKIDPYHNEMALRLAIQLTLDARIRARNQNPYDYRVISLLEEVLPRLELDRALNNKYKARDLKKRWNKALNLLMSLGWRIEFDPETYPDWLQPGSKDAKPQDWRKIKVIERLLQAKLTIKPPHPIPDLLDKIKDPKRPKAITPAAIVESLTGDIMKSARQNQGWSRKEIGGFLGVSADYIGKLERGDRFITPELEAKLRKLLHI